MLLIDLSPLICGLKKGKMCGGSTRAHENSPSITKQKVQSAMTPNKKPSVDENFSVKFSRCVKNATPVATSSPVTRAT
jgi:hypothetical protein